MACIGLLGVALWPATSRAGGLILHDRGARAMGRGFAMVAGADDPSAIYYNPAGLAGLERSLLADLTLTWVSASYTRVDSGGRTLPTAEADPVRLPIPTLAYADSFGLEAFTFGIGVSAPSSPLLRWPDGPDAPQRYSLISLAGTVLVRPAIAVAWRTPIPGLSVGISPGLVVGAFRARLAMSACDGTLCMLPEDPAYDVVAELSSGAIVRPQLTLGVTYQLWQVRFGLSATTPYNLGQEGQLRVRMPTAPIFGSASLSQDRVVYGLQMPWFLRAGIEVRPTDDVRIEAAAVVETWSQQRGVPVQLRGTSITDIEAIGEYELADVTLPLHMRDVVSLRLGAEVEVTEGLVLRGGGLYEPSAFDDQQRSALTVDADKWLVAGGATLQVGDLWLDVSLGHLLSADVRVSDTAVTQVNPVRPPAAPVPVGNGRYQQGAWLLGAGLRWTPTTTPQARQ